MRPPNNNLPEYAKKTTAYHLIHSEAWEKVIKFLKQNTVQDDGGITSLATETSQGIEIKRAE